MPRIRCRYDDCMFLEDGYCGAAAIELEPETGCLTFTRSEDAEAKGEDDWDEEELEEEVDEEDEDFLEEEDDDWDEEDDDDY